MQELSIDIETYSSEDLLKSGVYRYASAPDFEILLLAYAFDDEPVTVIDLTEESLPPEILAALSDADVLKTAYNANFERTCISSYFGIDLPVSQWRCSMIAAAELGLPQTLAAVAEALNLDEQKDSRGKALIAYFSKPCKPTEANSGRTRNKPEHDQEKWQMFKAYCAQDVETERAIKRRLAKFPMAESEQKLWEYDQRINDRGVLLDQKLVDAAVYFSDTYNDWCIKRSQEVTGLTNPNSLVQLKSWIEAQTGQAVDSLNKEALAELITQTANPDVQEALRLRTEMGKTSVSKYKAMQRVVCPDGRARGLLQFYGANRTGRWAGRLVQVQNLPQNHLPDLEYARKTVRSGDYELFQMLYGSPPQILSELIRTAFVPSGGRRFIVSDFSAIEARVVAYLADETWRQEVFAAGGDIYCASAAQMFKVPVVKNGVNGHLRAKGKIAELALGYGGSVGALTSMGALKMGLAEEELQPLVNSWRAANPKICAFWKAVEQAAMDAVKGHPSTLPHGLSFNRQAGILFIGLPSGRRLAYVKPAIGENRFGGMSLTYMGVNQTKRTWQRLETFGGKLVENIVQAFARDALAESIIRLENAGFEIVFHVHDEVVLDVPEGERSCAEVAEIMGKPLDWAPGLLLKAEAFETPFYKKD